jgi:hypothetical protein
MLWLVCRITRTRPQTRPQLDERHDAFVAVKRRIIGNGWCLICRHGLATTCYLFPSLQGL